MGKLGEKISDQTFGLATFHQIAVDHDSKFLDHVIHNLDLHASLSKEHLRLQLHYRVAVGWSRGKPETGRGRPGVPLGFLRGEKKAQ